MARRRLDDPRWDDRRLWERIEAEARFKQIDLSTFVTIQEAARIMSCREDVVYRRYLWLEGIELCGRKLVKRKRVEWLQKFRDGELPADDLMGESLAPYDVAATIAENERRKREEEEERRRKAEEERPKGFHVDGKIWWDYDNNDTWVGIDQAVINLGITRRAVHALGERGVIRRRWANKHTRQPVEKPVSKYGKAGFAAMFSLRDIEAFIAKRESRGRKRPVSFNDPDRPFTPVRVYDPEDSAHENCILPLWRVARILGVSRQRVSSLVTAGKLKAYQRIHSRQGVRAWFSAAEVNRYAKSEERVKFRQVYDERQARLIAGDDSKIDREPHRFAFGGPDIYQGVRNLRKSFGEYYTVRQAAQILGCAPETVRNKIKKGILPACRKNRKPGNDKWNDRRWWFIKKEDLDDYKGGREYRKRKQGFIAARHRKLFGEELYPERTKGKHQLREWPATPGEDHYVPHDPRNIVFLRGEQGRRRLEEYYRWWESEKNRVPNEPAVTPGEDRYIPHDPRNAIFLKSEHQRWLEETRAHLEELNSYKDDLRDGNYPPHYFNEGHRRFKPPSE